MSLRPTALSALGLLAAYGLSACAPDTEGGRLTPVSRTVPATNLTPVAAASGASVTAATPSQPFVRGGP